MNLTNHSRNIITSQRNDTDVQMASSIPFIGHNKGRQEITITVIIIMGHTLPVFTAGQEELIVILEVILEEETVDPEVVVVVVEAIVAEVVDADRI